MSTNFHKVTGMKRFSNGLSVLVVLLSLVATQSPRLFAQDPAAAEMNTPDADKAKPSLSEKWDRLIYVPFKELQKKFGFYWNSAAAK